MALELRILGLVLIALLVGGSASAQQMFVFPNQGQSQAQQNQDTGECQTWATNQTGFNPMMAGSTPPPANEPSQGGVLRGGARGAAVGAVAGAIAGNAGKGAAIGAASGGLIGGMRRNDQQRQQNANARNWQAQQDQARANWNRAFAACMQGKGYTVQ
jgi:hypothetical protein